MNEYDTLIHWCTVELGQVEVLTDHSREHAGLRAGAYRLGTAEGTCFVKVHRDRTHWESEVHAYEHWSSAFGRQAPRLIAVKDSEPLALILSEITGTTLENSPLPSSEEVKAWHSAGQALAKLHALETGDFFGLCHRDGSPVNPPIGDAVVFMNSTFEDWLRRGRRIDCLTKEELSISYTALKLLPAFTGEKPFPCHRDYCPPNWLVGADGKWKGVIDFEFSHWDVRTADISRFPDWNWIQKPELLEAFLNGYGCHVDERFLQQLLVSQILYALTAIVWGHESNYLGFAAEGSAALAFLAQS